MNQLSFNDKELKKLVRDVSKAWHKKLEAKLKRKLCNVIKSLGYEVDETQDILDSSYFKKTLILSDFITNYSSLLLLVIKGTKSKLYKNIVSNLEDNLYTALIFPVCNNEECAFYLASYTTDPSLSLSSLKGDSGAVLINTDLKLDDYAKLCLYVVQMDRIITSLVGPP